MATDADLQDVKSEQKLIHQKIDTLEKTTNKRFDAVEKRLDGQAEDLKNCVDDDEHQRTLSKMDKIYDIVLSIKDSNSAMQLAFTTAINNAQISNVKVDSKLWFILAGIGFVSSIIGAIVVVLVSKYI